MIRAVVFDVGETLVDESREYGAWADWLGVPRHAFSSVFGAVIAEGRDYRETFQHFRPGFDLDAQRARRAAAGQPETFGEGDLYPDARPAMEALQAMGVWVGVAGNQTSRAGGMDRRSLELNFEKNLLASTPVSPRPSVNDSSLPHPVDRRRSRNRQGPAFPHSTDRRRDPHGMTTALNPWVAPTRGRTVTGLGRV